MHFTVSHFLICLLCLKIWFLTFLYCSAWDWLIFSDHFFGHWMSVPLCLHFFLLVAVLSGKCHLSLCIYLCPCLSYTISLLHHLWTRCKKLYVCEGGRSFSHPSPSDWQFNLIHRFHLLCFTSNNPDNTQMFLPFHIHVCVCAFAKCVTLARFS